MSSKPESADTRQRLLDATIDVISEHGEAAVRLVDIAEAAGIKQPSIYHFYPNRDALVLAAYREWYRRSVLDVVDLFGVLVSTATSREEFVVGSQQGLRFAFDDERAKTRAIRIILFGKAMTNPELLAELSTAYYETTLKMAATLKTAQEKGWIRNDVDPVTLAGLVRSIILGRFSIEMDLSRYDGEAWTNLAVEAITLVLLHGAPEQTK